MFQSLQLKGPIVQLENDRKCPSWKNILKYSLSDFASQKTKLFFTRFGLSSSFLDIDPAMWETNFDYEEGWSFCCDLFVVNDTTERGVKFIKDYNRILTQNEEEKQLLLQIVEQYRKKYPNYKKSSLI